jgi:hypothetical protein
MSKQVKVGDIVEVNGISRIVTMVGNGFYQSEPYEKKEPEIEKIVVKAKKGKGKKDDNLV